MHEMPKKQPKIAIAALALLGLAACLDVPVDADVAPVNGIIRGTALYQGPHPCTQDGHVVGALVVLVFDQANPPPPTGIATTAVNFVAIPGDKLFANEPRETRPGVRTCASGDVTATASFAISPLDAGRYIIQAFYDTTGDFLPTFKIRNLPEKGDIGGGYIDTADAQLHLGDPNYQPIFLPIVVGNEQPNGAVTLPASGYVADNISVTVGESLPFTRPYFHPDGSDAPGNPTPTAANPNGTPAFAPVVTMTQDQQLLAPPASITPQAVQAFQDAFPSVKLDWGVATAEEQAALDPKQPFHMQSPTFDQGGGLLVWKAGGLIPEGQIPALYPIAVFAKLTADPQHVIDPQSLSAQGSAPVVPGQPVPAVVIIQGITLAGDSVFNTVLTGAPASPADPKARVDHLTALIRPSVICFDPRHIDQGGVLVTPHLTGASADDPNGSTDKPLFDPNAILQSQARLIKKVEQGCLPPGRYGINLVYSTGQAWTVPNEAGSCASDEGQIGPGSTAASAPPPDGLQSCQAKPRAVLPSQGTRAVLEIVPPPPGDTFCDAHPVPPECVSYSP